MLLQVKFIMARAEKRATSRTNRSKNLLRGKLPKNEQTKSSEWEEEKRFLFPLLKSDDVPVLFGAFIILPVMPFTHIALCYMLFM